MTVTKTDAGLVRLGLANERCALKPTSLQNWLQLARAFRDKLRGLPESIEVHGVQSPLAVRWNAAR